MNEKPSFWKRLFKRSQVQSDQNSASILEMTTNSEIKPLDIPPDDPLLTLITIAPGLIDVDKHDVDSPTLDRLRADGVKLVLPLVSQGDLVGLLNLGPRMSEQEYSSDDFRLLNNLATQASPALRVAQLARQQQLEARQRERIEQELRVARVIQETLLPREIPTIASWDLAAHWQPAREVSGDFYDFIPLEDGRLAVIVADVTDKGVPASLVMATTRSILRAQAEHLVSPGEVLARTNELLHPDIPAKMFVTCLYLVIEPESGKVVLANAGHNLPYVLHEGEVKELRATGMPLGLMPDMPYDELETTLTPGQALVLSSDGLVEAHNNQGEMYGFRRFKTNLAAVDDGVETIPAVMRSWTDFIGEDHLQEDDITLVTLRFAEGVNQEDEDQSWKQVAAFELPSKPGEERQASQQVLNALAPYGLTKTQERRLRTAVAEATMNAMEHGNQFQEELPIQIEVLSRENEVAVHICDFGKTPIEDSQAVPDIDAKIAGLQSPRGWGLFLIKNMVDEMHVRDGDQHHMIELIVKLED